MAGAIFILAIGCIFQSSGGIEFFPKALPVPAAVSPKSLGSALTSVPGVGAVSSLAAASVPETVDPKNVLSSPSFLTSVPGVGMLTNLTSSIPSVPNPFGSSSNESNWEFSEEALVKAVENYVPDVGLISDDPNLIRFLLFNDAQNPNVPEVLELGNLDSVENSLYDSAKPTKFLVHGFQQNYNSSYPQNVKNAYLARGQDYNVIVVDWGLLSIPNAPYIAPVFYPFAVKNVWRTGERLGEFLTWLHNISLITHDQIHIVGFSLGSHVSGKAGSVFQDALKKDVARVTALDPAGPEFYTGIFARSMKPTDGQYVDAIHTNAGQLGIWANVGQMDVYLNGGTGPQPGCLAFTTIDKAFRSLTGAITGTCSHNAATLFYAQSILLGETRSGDFTACSCDSLTGYKLSMCGCSSYVTFGENSRRGTKGTQYMQYKPYTPK